MAWSSHRYAGRQADRHWVEVMSTSEIMGVEASRRRLHCLYLNSILG